MTRPVESPRLSVLIGRYQGVSIDVLVVCSAGRCRSPIAAALLGVHAETAAAKLQAHSGALVGAHGAMPPVGVTLMNELGIDLSRHRSLPVTPESMRAADLIFGIDREHVRELISRSPDVRPKTFTLTEFVHRAEQAAPRGRHQRLTDWLDQVGDGRGDDGADLVGVADDIVDPYAQRPEVWRAVIAQLDDLTQRAVAVLGTRRSLAR